MQIEEASRQGMIPLIGVYGKSGSGKTHSALLLARGIAGDKPIGIIDTERKRSGALVGLIPGGFKRINLDAPFSPETYQEAIAMFEASNLGCAVIDSLTHEWDGEGGILDAQEEELTRMAGTDYKKREACKMAAWIKPKMRHKALVAHILRCNIPLICCLRADEKTHIEKQDGRTKVSTDEFTTPIYDKRFIFEMLCNMETVQRDGKPGHVRVTKWTHPDLLKCLPTEREQVTVKHGEAVAHFCAATSAPAQTQPGTESKTIKSAKSKLWNLTRGIHAGDAIRLQQWLWDEACLDPNVCLSDVTNEAELEAVILLATKKLGAHGSP